MFVHARVQVRARQDLTAITLPPLACAYARSSSLQIAHADDAPRVLSPAPRGGSIESMDNKWQPHPPAKAKVKEWEQAVAKVETEKEASLWPT